MQAPPERREDSGWTRSRFARAALAAGAIVGGGAAAGALGRDGDSLAAPSKSGDADILNLFLVLESLQESFYREAVAAGRLDGDLLTFARTVAGQEAEHVAFLRERLGDRADRPPAGSFDSALSTPEGFRDTAIDLEEATLAVYIGQGANLTRAALGEVATLVSVEARQAAWIRDIAGTSPAPRAADPARTAEATLKDLRARGWLG